MTDRKDLAPVEIFISRLIAIGRQLREKDREWSHLKNGEDFRKIYDLDSPDQHKIAKIYGEGRDMALGLSELLISINYDISTYPTLTKIIERLKNSTLYSERNCHIVARELCAKHGIDLWAINQMCLLYEEQISLADAAKSTVEILLKSDLYKLENGMAITQPNNPNITISGVSNSNVSLHSPGSQQNLIANHNEAEVFKELVEAIKSSQIPKAEADTLVAQVNTLQQRHKSGQYALGYQEFISNVASHLTIILPFIPALTKLLSA